MTALCIREKGLIPAEDYSCCSSGFLLVKTGSSEFWQIALCLTRCYTAPVRVIPECHTNPKPRNAIVGQGHIIQLYRWRAEAQYAMRLPHGHTRGL